MLIAACIAAFVALCFSAAFVYSVCARLNKLEDASSGHLTRWAYWSDRVRVLQAKVAHLEKDAGIVPSIHLVELEDEPTYPGRPRSVRPPAAK